MKQITRIAIAAAAVVITSPIGLALAGGGATDSGALWAVHAIARLVEAVRSFL